MIAKNDLLAAAKLAQYKTIKRWLLNHYSGDVAIIGKWSDHYYGICSFPAWNVNLGISTNAIRARLKREAELLGIRVIKRAGRHGHVSFQFNRQTCDEMAEQARMELIAEGYSETEKRAIKP